MPATSFLEYAKEIEELLNSVVAAGEAVLVDIQIDQRSSFRGFIKGLLEFSDASELYIREFVDTTQPEPRLMYAYHYQDKNSALIFRYDNATHRPVLPQMEHKHTPAGVEVSSAPTLAQVVDSIQRGTQT